MVTNEKLPITHLANVILPLYIHFRESLNLVIATLKAAITDLAIVI